MLANSIISKPLSIAAFGSISLDEKDLQISARFCGTSYFETTKEQEVLNVTKVGAKTVKHRSSGMEGTFFLTQQ